MDTMKNIFDKLIKKFPHHLINVSINYSPGAKGDYFYYSKVTVNADQQFLDDGIYKSAEMAIAGLDSKI